MGTPLTRHASNEQMLLRVTRSFVLLAVLVAAACGPAASTASPSPTATATVASASPTPTATTSPTSSQSASRSPIPLPNTAQVAAAGNGVVWMLVAHDRLFRSLDRGETWAERTLPADLPMTAIAFVSDREGWIAAAGSPATQRQAQSVAIWHTSDGAATWTSLNATGIADAQCKGAFAFRDAQHGYLSTWSQNAAPVIYRTADGGRTWSASTPLPDPPGFTTQPGGFSLEAGMVADFGATLFVAAYGQVNGQMRSYVFRSTDGGATWTFAGTAPQAQTGVVFLTPQRWFELLLPGPSTETTDGGGTWHPYASDYQQAAPIAPAIVFGDASVGYATVRGTLKRTIDGGAHWTSLKTPGT